MRIALTPVSSRAGLDVMILSIACICCFIDKLYLLETHLIDKRDGLKYPLFRRATEAVSTKFTCGISLRTVLYS